MIAFLSGKPMIASDSLIINVNGVGYQVFVPPSVYQQARPDENLSIFVYTHVREDRLELYGFATAEEKALFQLLLSVSGIGPSTALNLVAAGNTKVVTAVQQAEVSFFTAIPRVGKKLAQKIIIELRTKLGEMKELDLGPQSPERQDLIESLMGLGFDESSVMKVIEEMAVEEIGVQKALPLALKKLKK